MTDGDELATFLRSRREQLKPEQVGISTIGRRRTPGLRREELATIAGLSSEYLQRLERGRDTNPSVEVLAALAKALQLSEDEKRHLVLLAAQRYSGVISPTPGSLTDEPRPTERVLLKHLDPTPACLLGPTCNVVAWNSAWEKVVRPLGVLDEDHPNFIRYHFLNPRARQVFADSWAATADELVGWLRSVQPAWGANGQFCSLVDTLSESSEFASRWVTHPVVYKQPGGKILSHPDAGILNVTLEILLVGEAGQWLHLWLPCDERTASAIESLIAAPAPLADL